MDGAFSWWGLGLNETLLIIAAILVLIDIFFASDVPTHAAYVLVAVVLARLVPAHLLYQVLIGVGAWFVLVGGHYLLWRKRLQRFVHRYIAPERYRCGARGLIGTVGHVKKIEEATLVSAAGDLWPFRSAEPVEAGASVRIVGVKGGELVVKPLAEGA